MGRDVGHEQTSSLLDCFNAAFIYPGSKSTWSYVQYITISADNSSVFVFYVYCKSVMSVYVPVGVLINRKTKVHGAPCVLCAHYLKIPLL